MAGANGLLGSDVKHFADRSEGGGLAQNISRLYLEIFSLNKDKKVRRV